MNFSGLQNMWDLTPDTDLLKELPEEYTFETALADLIVSCLIQLANWSGCVLDLFCLLGAYTLLLVYQDNSLQAVWSNSQNDRRLIRYGIAVFIIRLGQACCLQLEFYQLLDLYVQWNIM